MLTAIHRVILFNLAVVLLSVLPTPLAVVRGEAQTAAAATLHVITPDRVVPGPPTDRPLFEPHLAASPTRRGHLIGAAIVAEPTELFGPGQQCVGIVSFDAGRNWESHLFDLTHCGDPWVAIGANGDAWFSALGQRAAEASHRMYLYRSSDGGRTWTEPPVDFGSGHDHQTLIAGRVDAAGRQPLYLISSLGRRTDVASFHAHIARSPDEGSAWPAPLIATPSNLNFNTLAGGQLADGTLLIPFIDSQAPGSSGMLARRRAWVYRATPDLATLSPPMLISEECTSNTGFGSLFTVPGSARALFICVSSAQSLVVHATDDGFRWTDAEVLEAPAGVAQRVPAGAATPKGTVALAWMDSREAPDTCFRLRAAISLDGGRTFGSSEAVSAEVSCPQAEVNGVAGRRWRNSGDYSGLAAGADGVFYALWADSRAGLSHLRFAAFGERAPSE